MKLLLLTIILGAMVAAQDDSRMPENFAAVSSKFTADVYKELLKSHSGNFLVCPLSVETVLALVHTGAGGQTAHQLTKALYLPENKQEVQELFKKVAPHLQGNEHYNLSSANKIYVKDGYQIKDQFKNIAVNIFNADIQTIEFAEKQQAANEINKWVEDKTHEKIKNLIDPNSLSPDTRSILINAMYFQGNWLNPFQKRATRKRDFYLNDQNKIQADMMEQTTAFKYFESSDLKAKFLEMPYAGEDVTMTFVLPNEKEGLSVLEEHLEAVFEAPKYSSPEVHVIIPKFTIESKIEFKPILQALGVKDAFEDDADFDEILVDTPLKISKVIQKAFMEVEEEGTTAAAATYVEMVETYSLIQYIGKIEEFIADHPFIFYIKIKDVVFFAGRYTSPQ